MGRRRSSTEEWDGRVRVGRFFTLLGLVGVILAAVLVWQWVMALSSDALALAGGVIIGIVAVLVPLSLISLGAYLAARYLEARQAARPQAQPQPPVVIVSGGQMWPGMPGYTPEQYPPMLTTEGGNGNGRKTPRSFSVIGDDQD